MPNRTVPPGVARVFTVDQDEETQFSLLNLFQLANIDCRSFETCADLFDPADLKAPGCLLLDTNLQDINGFDAQQRLATPRFSLPIVFMTGNATIPMPVEREKVRSNSSLLRSEPKPSFGKFRLCRGDNFFGSQPKEIEMQIFRYFTLAMVWFNVVLAGWLSIHMLYDPEGWYYFVPGVTDTGFYNQHFIRDIGIIQGFIALAFAIGTFKPDRRIELWAAATLWLIAHACFHMWEVAVGICSASVLLRDFPAVSLPALFGIAGTLWACAQSKAAGRSLATANL
ncbi:response regulator [Rhizobium leguminosarum]|uniref:response regulator n=1 Tax=Rhizobium leguminosarum TaxID=384 RepID=UPI0009E1B4BD|nr:response regulator [Rhizobium leguminosarum]WFT86780.1 response regulator [Rhizobium leguminosarum]